MARLVLHAQIAHHMHFDRKNYFYPDNPKAYQITPIRYPIAHDGWIEIEVNGKKKRSVSRKMHIEEDAGKNTHTSKYSYVDLNRQGTPLIEIVSKPDIASPRRSSGLLWKHCVNGSNLQGSLMEDGRRVHAG